MKKTLIYLFCICAGIVLGSLVAELCADISGFGWLDYHMNFGLNEPFTLDLNVLVLTLGLSFRLSISVIIFVAIGILAAVLLTSGRHAKRGRS